MDWTDFAQRLTRELIHLPIDAFVIVQGPGGLPYVQAMRYRNGLHAEAVSSDYLPEPLDAGQESLLSQMGWLAPDGRARRNWWCRVMLPPDIADITPEQAAECGELADRMVGAFSDVYRVPSVAELTYEASRVGQAPGSLPMPGLGIPAADVEPPAGETALNWTDFTEHLAGELASMEPEMALVISHRLQGSYYVQAFRDMRRVRAEAVSGRALPPSAPAFDERAEERLAEAGWRRPGEHPNWTCELPADASPKEYRRLAAMMVVALRDVQMAGSPADLVYEAFIGASHVELTEFGIALADPGRVDARRTSRPLPGRVPETGPQPSVPPQPVAEPVAAVDPTPATRAAQSDVESELIAAKARGDQGGYLAVLLRTVLYVPVTEDGQPVTADFRDGTYVLAFTSPQDMDWSLGGTLMDYRRTTFTELACGWQRPDWQLAVNTRLPSAAYIDTGTIMRTAERAGGMRPVPGGPAGAPATKPATGDAALAWSALVPRPDEPAAGQDDRDEAADVPQDERSACDDRAEIASPLPGGPPAAAASLPSSGDRAPAADLVRAGSPGDDAGTPAAEPSPGDPALAADPPKDDTGTSGTGRFTAEPPPGVPISDTGPVPAEPDRDGTDAPRTEPAASPPDDRDAAPDVPRAEPGKAEAPDDGRPTTEFFYGDRTRTAKAFQTGPIPIVTEAHEQAPKVSRDERLEEGVVMQKVIRPDHVVHYLDGGYDWVAGRIHRLEDVSELRTAGQLVRELGLEREGSPFSARDPQVHVIRWPVLKPALVRPDSSAAGSAVPAFWISSQRLPHGAEMFGVDQAGNESFLAVYDADVRGWIRIEEGAQ